MLSKLFLISYRRNNIPCLIISILQVKYIILILSPHAELPLKYRKGAEETSTAKVLQNSVASSSHKSTANIPHRCRRGSTEVPQRYRMSTANVLRKSLTSSCHKCRNGVVKVPQIYRRGTTMVPQHCIP